ncbi:MAG: hypothetical protein ACXQTW_00825 [Candidatus Methanospirareceae archaeon]
MKVAMKVRVEVIDEEGVKSSLEKEGDLQLEMFRQLTIRDVVTFLEKQLSPPPVRNAYGGEDLTIKERLASFLRFDERAPEGWFTSSEIKRIYEEVFDENVRLSTISTYLASLHSDGILERKGSRAKRQYRLVSTESTEAVSTVNNSVFGT